MKTILDNRSIGAVHLIWFLSIPLFSNVAALGATMVKESDLVVGEPAFSDAQTAQGGITIALRFDTGNLFEPETEPGLSHPSTAIQNEEATQEAGKIPDEVSPPLGPHPAPRKGEIEVGGGHHVLTDGEKNWEDTYFRSTWFRDAENTLHFELVHARRFNDEGTFYGGGMTHTFNQDWYMSAALGSSAAGFLFLPEYRIDAFIHRKFLEKRNLVLDVGLTDYKAKDSHRDRILHIGANYYFESPWIAALEFLANNSSPGNVIANYGYASITYGQNKKSYLTFRYGAGKEAYQIIDQSQAISGFYSSIMSVSYRSWLGKDYGFALLGENYQNPRYKRYGLELGLFKEF